MSTTSKLIKTGLEEAIAGITPTERPTRRFKVSPRDAATLSTQSVPSSAERMFEIHHGPGHLGDTHTVAQAETVQQFLIIVCYPEEGNWDALDDVIRSDVSDIRRALHDTGNWAEDTIHQIAGEWSAPEHDAPGGRFLQGITVIVKFLETT